MARNEQLIRQHKILQVLERMRFGRTLDELKDNVTEELGLTSIHTRTLRRDLDALQAAGIDIATEDSPRGKVWKLGSLAKKPVSISATATELIALSLSRQLLHPLAGTPFWMGIESFWNKINQEIPDSVVKHYEKFRQTLRVLGVPAKSYEKHHGMIKTINRAILEHRVVEIEYTSVGKGPTTRRIEPYTIALFQSSLYILAANHGEPTVTAETMRTFKLDRFNKAKLLDAWFKPDPNIDVEQITKEALGIYFGKPRNFKIRISPRASTWVREDPWHPEQQIRELKDGWIELTVKAAHEMEIVPRVLQLGDEAELISPKSTRQHLAQTAQRMVSRYGNS